MEAQKRALCRDRDSYTKDNVNSPHSSVSKVSPAMQETWVCSLGWEDPLEEGMATHSSIPDWRIPWTEEPGRLQSMGLQELDST